MTPTLPALLLLAVLAPSLANPLAATVVIPPGPVDFYSFEEGEGALHLHPADESLELTTRQHRDGHRSLGWRWKAGERLDIDFPPVDINRPGGPYQPNCWYPAFNFWALVETPPPGPFRMLFSHEGRALGGWTVPLDAPGVWRYGRAVYRAAPDFDRKIAYTGTQLVSRVTFLPPEGADEGTLYLDLLFPDRMYPLGASLLPVEGERASSRATMENFFRELTASLNTNRTAALPDATLARVRQVGVDVGMAAQAPPPPASEKQIADAHQAAGDLLGPARIAPWEGAATYIHEDISMRESAPARRAAPARRVNSNTVKNLLTRLATLHAAAAEPAARERLATDFTDILMWVDHQEGLLLCAPRILEERAFAAMREVLAGRGLYDALAGGYFCTVQKGVAAPDPLAAGLMGAPFMPDDIESLGWGGGRLKSDVRRLFLLGDDAVVAEGLARYRQKLSAAILHDSPGAGYMSDGTVVHHGLANWSYASYCMPGMADNLPFLVRNDLITPEAHALLREACLRTRIYSAGDRIPTALRARWVCRDIGLSPAILRGAALAGSVDRTQPVDLEAARALLRLFPTEGNREPFKSLALTPEPDPEVNLHLPWSGLMAHRRAGWVATVKGFNGTAAAFEMMNSSRFARYLSHGLLEVHNGAASGALSCDGLDWNHLPGTTALVLPLERLHRNLGRPRNREDFAGGVTHRGRDGAFGLKLVDIADPAFRARKSWFCFDDRIVCLGSGIVSTNAVDPVHTTLFQHRLERPDQPVHLGGAPVADFPLARTMTTSAAAEAWLMDAQGVGYFPASGQTLVLERRHQVSYDGSSADARDFGAKTEADAVLAWLDHGVAPRDGRYAYTVVPGRTPAALAGFAAALADPDSTPFRVLLQDQRAHIVWDRASNRTGAVIFEPGALPEAAAPIQAADRACVVMFEPDAGGWILSVCDPVIHLVRPEKNPAEYQTASTTLTLHGRWHLADPTPFATLAELPAEQTEITLTFSKAESRSVRLRP